MNTHHPFRLSVLAFAALTATACTNTLSHNIDSNGHVQKSDLIFPKLDKAWQKEGMGSLNADVYLKIFYQHKHLFPESWHKKFHNPSLVEYLYSLIKRLRFKYIYKIF